MNVLAKKIQEVVVNVVSMVASVVSVVHCDIFPFSTYELVAEVVECRWYV